MKNQTLALVAFGLTALCIIGAVILTAIGKAVPSDLWTVAFASLAGGAGIAIPTTGATTLSITRD